MHKYGNLTKMLQFTVFGPFLCHHVFRYLRDDVSKVLSKFLSLHLSAKSLFLFTRVTISQDVFQ